MQKHIKWSSLLRLSVVIVASEALGIYLGAASAILPFFIILLALWLWVKEGAQMQAAEEIKPPPDNVTYLRIRPRPKSSSDDDGGGHAA